MRMRLVALAIVLALVARAGLVLGLLVLGPHLESWLGDAIGAPTLTAWLWWTVQWPCSCSACSSRSRSCSTSRRTWSSRAGSSSRLAPWPRSSAGSSPRRARRLRGELRLVRQDVGNALGGDRDARLALDHERGAALRRRGERGGPTPRRGAGPRCRVGLSRRNQSLRRRFCASADPRAPCGSRASPCAGPGSLRTVVRTIARPCW